MDIIIGNKTVQVYSNARTPKRRNCTAGPAAWGTCRTSGLGSGPGGRSAASLAVHTRTWSLAQPEHYCCCCCWKYRMRNCFCWVGGCFWTLKASAMRLRLDDSTRLSIGNIHSFRCSVDSRRRILGSGSRQAYEWCDTRTGDYSQYIEVRSLTNHSYLLLYYYHHQKLRLSIRKSHNLQSAGESKRRTAALCWRLLSAQYAPHRARYGQCNWEPCSSLDWRHPST